MTGFDFSTNKKYHEKLPDITKNSRIAATCFTQELSGLMDVFHWDADTVEECTNIDETVRYASYDGYDFVSLIYAEIDGGKVLQQEINIFFAENYLVLVVPQHMGGMLEKLVQGYEKAADLAASRSEPLVYLYYFIFDALATDYSNMLESLEDEAEVLSEAIENSPKKSQSFQIGYLRRKIYIYKKLLRSLSYIGGQVLIDENGLLDSRKSRYFRNIDTRLIKLYDFADNLFDSTHGLLHSYDSKVAAQMNEMVNKLTIITLFFGPMTVIAGIYGMNFKNMPELDWQFGYPMAIGLMILISLAIYFYLKKRKWL
ncbi:MAG: magnesium transporter CorA family protein [Clostridiales bacterium]|jgi:magnesium transporter|nr:magnesium transporter CorA family protein [Clostridiales bacterium]